MKILLFVCYEHARILHTQFWFDTQTPSNLNGWFILFVACISGNWDVCVCYCESFTDVRTFKVVKTLEIGLDSGVFRRSRQIYEMENGISVRFGLKSLEFLFSLRFIRALLASEFDVT